MCACAWTGSTIAPTAAKPAMSPWPPAVVTEAKSFRLLLEADARLAAAAGGIVRYLADAAGFESDAIARLQSAVIAACLQAFDHLTANHPLLEITFSRHSDRLEISLSHQGESAPAVGLDSIAGFATPGAGTASPDGVFGVFDRVQYESSAGQAVTRLTKYFSDSALSA